MGLSDIICMAIVVGFLAAVGVSGLRRNNSSERFFDKTESNALRGFWCLIIVLVHVPAAYQNPIQDAIGSFAYIGVTFFFMTSAYGLEASLKKYPERYYGFWQRRLPKLLVPCFVVNFFDLALTLAIGQPYIPLSLIRVNNWVIWLLACYTLWWIAVRAFGSLDAARCIGVIVGVAAISMAGYIFADSSPVGHWPTEVWGFAWGMLLVRFRDRVFKTTRNRLLVTMISSIAVAFILGVAYLHLKPVPIYGDYLLKIGLGASLILIMLESDSIWLFAGRLNSFLGSISYEVYLIHSVVFRVMSSMLSGRGASGPFILGCLLISVLLAYCAHRISSFLLRSNVSLSAKD